MSECKESFFGTVVTEGDVSRYVHSDVTTAIARSNALYAPANSTVCVNISGTATVVIKSNPFSDSAKDVTLTSVSANTEYVVTSAKYIVVDVTAVSGTVTAILVSNEV